MSVYGDIRATLEKVGTPIGSMALWIGATSEYERVIRSSLTKALHEVTKEFAGEEFNKHLKKITRTLNRQIVSTKTDG